MEVENKHTTVLLNEAVEALNVSEQTGVFIDATFGVGGHSRQILRAMNADSILYAYDKDPHAASIAQLLETEDKRFRLSNLALRNLVLTCSSLDWLGNISGILMDLGVSSRQLDEAERGFSFMQDGPLNMRMDSAGKQTAADWIKNVQEKELADTIYRYGDERYSRRIAKAIVAARKCKPITRTLQLWRCLRMQFQEGDRESIQQQGLFRLLEW